MNNQTTPNTIAPIKSVPKVSVIVPVYNTELYVERAIVSLLGQTLDDVQFIIIDDGSKDNSLAIIKQVIARYPARQAQVTLISRENRGVAATRVQGMGIATGEYIIHLDSDDWAELNWLEMMYTKAIEEKADVVVCDYAAVYEYETEYIKQTVVSDGVECIGKLFMGELHGATWNKLIRRDLISDNNLLFPRGVNYLEDVFFVVQVFVLAKDICHLASPLIHYNKINEHSITSRISLDKVGDITSATTLIESFLDKNGLLDILEFQLDNFKLNQKSWMIYSMRKNVPDYLWGLYPESNKTIWRSCRPLYMKVILYFGLSRFSFVSSLLLRLADKVRSIVK